MAASSPLLPGDDFDQQLESNVRPVDWVPPTPKDRYNLVVIGAGTAGLVTAAGAASLGARVALIERGLMGGDCLNVGCVPSKALISAARMASTVRNAQSFGVEVPDQVNVYFARVMQRLRQLRAHISTNDSAQRFRDLGVDVYFGEARFMSSDTVEVDSTRLRFKKAVIATGSRPTIPDIPGLSSVKYLTNETLFSLTELPAKLGIIGAGPIGCEMAQAFAQLGSRVFLVESKHGILSHEDRDAAGVVQRAMERQGVEIWCCGKNLHIANNRGICLQVESHGRKHDQPVDQLLVAVGRTPNIESLNLESVGVACQPKGIVVNERMQTTNPRIYAAGDVCSQYQFTHAADFMARIVVQNALFLGRRTSSSLVIPWCTYTTPEIAHVGLYEHEAHVKGIACDCYVQKWEEVDRAILDGEEEGFVKVLVKKGTDHIVGATIVAHQAGDLLSEITLAMTCRLGLSRIGNTIHPYPTRAEAIRKLGDQYSRTRLTPLIKSLSSKWLAWTR